MKRLTGDKKKAIAARLADLHRRGGGRLTTDAVINDAKNPKSPLHDQFTWDVQKAAYEHWQQEARELITSVKYVCETKETIIRLPMYHRDPTCASSEPGYMDIPKMRNDQDIARDALIEAFRTVGDMLRRARELAVVLEMESEVGRLLDGVMELRRQAMERPPAQMQ